MEEIGGGDAAGDEALAVAGAQAALLDRLGLAEETGGGPELALGADGALAPAGAALVLVLLLRRRAPHSLSPSLPLPPSFPPSFYPSLLPLSLSSSPSSSLIVSHSLTL